MTPSERAKVVAQSLAKKWAQRPDGDGVVFWTDARIDKDHFWRFDDIVEQVRDISEALDTFAADAAREEREACEQAIDRLINYCAVSELDATHNRTIEACKCAIRARTPASGEEKCPMCNGGQFPDSHADACQYRAPRP